MKKFGVVFSALALAACNMSAEPLEAIAFGPATPENVEFFEIVPERKGWDGTNLIRRDDDRNFQEFRRVGTDAVAEQKTELHRQCVLSRGGSVVQAQQMTYPDGDIGLLVTCSQ